MLNRRQFVVGAGACVIAQPLFAAATATEDSVRENVSAYLKPLLARNDYSGFVLLERDGRTLLAEGFGFADDAQRVPHTADTHYGSDSVSKMFTRAAILSLERSGALNRNDRISRFLPEFPSGGAITVQQLIDHKGGIARDLPQDTDLRRPRSTQELVRLIATMPIESKPGERTSYSNNGYRLLARIIEVAARGHYDSIVRETVFEPRGMRSTFPNMPSSHFPRQTRGYWPGAGWGSKVPALPIDRSNQRGAGSFAITAADMLRFLKTLPLELPDLEEAAPKDGAPRSVGHDGFGEGYANLTYAYPDQKAYLISLSNMQTGAFMPMHQDMRHMLFGQAVPTPTLPPPIPAPPITNWDRFVGDFDLRPGAPLRIRRSGDHLTADAGEGGHPLIALGGDRFFMRLRYATMVFEGDPDKPASLLRWAEGGGEFPLKRIAHAAPSALMGA
jgi:CubicO group peptidase (beta-lactamase class C family)